MNSTILNSYSGIKTHQFGLDSISNNIANVNTVGFRQNNPTFESLFSAPSSTINSNSPVSNDYNFGVSGASNAISTKSGSYISSDGDFHVAYEGKGWFVVGEKSDGELEVEENGLSQKQKNYFTRDGSFGKDAEGYLVNSKGYYVYGVNLGKIKDGIFTSTPASDDVKNLASNKLTPLMIPQNLYFKPNQTTKLDISVNLNKSSNPQNAFDAFSKNGKFLENEFLDSNLAMFFANGNQLKGGDASIKIKDLNGVEKTFEFEYGGNGENGFKTLRELKNLIESNTSLSLGISKDSSGSVDKNVSLSITSPSFENMSVSLSGRVFDGLGLSVEEQKLNSLVKSYNPNKTYEQNELVSHMGIIYKRVDSQGSNNPLLDPRGWEMLDTSNVEKYSPDKSYASGSLVNKDGSIYLKDNASLNEFIKIGEEKKLEIKDFDPSKNYAQNEIVRLQGALYKKISREGNTDPLADGRGWERLKGDSVSGTPLEVPHYRSSTDIFDESGKKFSLISDYYLVASNDGGEKWEIRSGVYDIGTQKLLSKAPSTHYIDFDADGNPNAQETKIEFDGKEISYSVAGVGDKKSTSAQYIDSMTLSSSQDGKSEGVLQNVSIDNNGVILLSFSNGEQEAMGRVGIMAFTNDQGLSKVGGNLFESRESVVNSKKVTLSGKPSLGWGSDGNLRFGSVLYKYLENSNVDVGSALTDLIVMQRGYSMNAKTFTTGDEMIREAINLKK